MDNLFENPSVDYFAEDETSRALAPSMSSEQVTRTAGLGALALGDPSEQAGRIFASLDAEAEILRRQIETTGESTVRREASARNLQERAEGLSKVITDNLDFGDPALVEGATVAYSNLVQLDAAEEEDYALEQRAVRRVQDLAASGDITQARILLSNLEHGGPLDVIEDYLTKQQILESVLMRAEQDVRNQSWLRHAADFVLSVVPLYGPSRTGNVPVADHVKNWYDSLFSGERFRNEADSLWDMPLAEFSKFVQNDLMPGVLENSTLLGYTNNTEKLELLSGLTDRTPSAWETNAWVGLDVGGFVPWTRAFKIGGSIPSMMVRAGARKEASELTARAALDIVQESSDAAGRSMMTPEQVANNLQVSAVAPEGSMSIVPVATDAGSAIERGRALLSQLPELEKQARLNPQEINRAVETTLERLERQYGRELKDVAVLGPSDNSALTRITFTLGRKDGLGFASEAQANRYIGSIGETGTAIQDEAGQWFARIAHDLPETGFVTRLLSVKTPSPWRFVLNARNIGDVELADAAQVAGNTRNLLLKNLVDPYSDVFRALRGSERDDLAQVIQAGENMGRWFTPDEFENLYRRRWDRAPSTREQAAYQAAKDINDIEYTLRNEALHKERALRGYRTVSFDTGLGRVDRANAIVDAELKTPPTSRVYDVSQQRHYTETIPARTFERMRNQGYRIVTLEQPLRMADGTAIRTFAVKGKDFVNESLRLDQVAYRPGGHRMYRGKYFVKQTVKGVQPDTGREFLDNPNTYIAAETKAEAEFWASRMEAARLAYLDGADLGVLDEILGGHAGLPEAKDFIRMLESPEGAFQKETPFGVYYDREMPREYVAPGANVEFVDMEEGGFNGLLRTQGRMYTGRKGEALPDYMGNMAPTLDPYETINRSLMNIASLSSFSDYKIQAVERWMKTFRPYLDIRPGDALEDASDMRKFIEAPLVKGGNDELNRIRNAAIAQRQIIMRTLGWKTENDLRADQWARHLNEWVQGSRVDGVLPNARKELSLWWQDKNPISALRSFAFDLKLGMFNFAQLPLQISTAVAAIAMSPKHGAQGAALIAPMRFLLGGRSLSREAFESRVDELIKRDVHKIGGFEDAREFKEYARAAVRSGFFDLGGTHGLMDHYGPSATLDGFNSGVKRVREAGRFFFFEAERWNRLTAWRIAWAEAKESGLKPGTAEFAARLQGRAEEYSFNMSRESQAWWQKGFMSIPTQFWAYNVRMIEAMTVGNFTKEQKMRLFLSQTLLYGSAGIPLTGFLSEMVKNKTGEVASIETLLGTADRGLLDRFVYELTGADVLVGERYGTGNWASDVVRNILGMSQYGEVSTADVLGGATFSIMGKLGTDVLKPMFEYAAAESGDQGLPINRSSLLKMATNISTIGNTLKALMVWNYGVYQSNSGLTQVTGLPPQDAFAVALGIQPAEMDVLSARNAFVKNRSTAVREAANVISNYRADMLNRPDQRESIMAEVNAFVRLLPDDIRADALERAHGQTDASLYDSVTKRYERLRAQEELRNGLSD